MPDTMAVHGCVIVVGAIIINDRRDADYHNARERWKEEVDASGGCGGERYRRAKRHRAYAKEFFTDHFEYFLWFDVAVDGISGCLQPCGDGGREKAIPIRCMRKTTAY